MNKTLTHLISIWPDLYNSLVRIDKDTLCETIYDKKQTEYILGYYKKFEDIGIGLLDEMILMQDHGLVDEELTRKFQNSLTHLHNYILAFEGTLLLNSQVDTSCIPLKSSCE